MYVIIICVTKYHVVIPYFIFIVSKVLIFWLYFLYCVDITVNIIQTTLSLFSRKFLALIRLLFLTWNFFITKCFWRGLIRRISLIYNLTSSDVCKPLIAMIYVTYLFILKGHKRTGEFYCTTALTSPYHFNWHERDKTSNHFSFKGISIIIETVNHWNIYIQNTY